MAERLGGSVRPRGRGLAARAARRRPRRAAEQVPRATRTRSRPRRSSCSSKGPSSPAPGARARLRRAPRRDPGAPAARRRAARGARGASPSKLKDAALRLGALNWGAVLRRPARHAGQARRRSPTPSSTWRSPPTSCCGGSPAGRRRPRPSAGRARSSPRSARRRSKLHVLFDEALDASLQEHVARCTRPRDEGGHLPRQARRPRRHRSRPDDRGADRRDRPGHLDRHLRLRPAPVRGDGRVHGRGRHPRPRADGHRRGGRLGGHATSSRATGW